LNSKEKITDSQRNMLLKKLHRPLFWVGEYVPTKIEIDGKNFKLHEIIWEILNKKYFSTNDIENMELFLSMLREKEQEYERRLEHNNISYEEAKKLFKQTAGLMRAIMDLTEIEDESKRKKMKDAKHICEGIEDKEWKHFVETIIMEKKSRK